MKKLIAAMAAVLLIQLLFSCGSDGSPSLDLPATTEQPPPASQTDEIQPTPPTDETLSNPQTDKPAEKETEPVTAAPVDVTQIAFNVNEYSLEPGTSITLKATISPYNAADTKLAWSTSNPNVAKVGSDGKVTASKVGTATITAKSSNGVFATCKISVITVDAKAISFDQSAITLEEDKTAKLSVIFDPVNTTDKTLTWSTSDPTVARVNEGKIIAESGGNAVIRAKTANGLYASCSVTVTAKPVAVTEVFLGRSELTLSIGESFTFEPSVAPFNASDRTVILGSSDRSIAEVSGFTVTAKSVGSAIISAVSSNGISTNCTVTVAEKSAETQPPVEEIKLPASAKPVITGKAVVSNGRWCVAGSCEEGAVISVGGHNIDTFTVNAQEKRFFFSVKIASGRSEELTIIATVEGKSASQPVTLELEYSKGGCDVVVGQYSQLHYPYTKDDFCGTNLFSDSDLQTLQSVMYKRLEQIRKKSGRDDTKLIFLIAPNNATIYPEYAPEAWVSDKKSDNSRLQQVVKLINGFNDPDVTVIDLTDYIKSQKKLGKLYFQTDTHWNTLGAYFGYEKLMEAIAVDFPAAAPYSLDKFKVEPYIRSGGDLVSFLGIGNDNGSELTYACTRDFESAVTSKIDNSDCITTTVDNADLPTAVVQRDSFGAALHDFLVEHFSTLIYTPFGCDADTALKSVAELSPDYYIRIMVERDLYGKIIN